MSGIALDDVRVHRNSPEPARLGAHAFAQGADIHLGPGQERHLPHEAWHIVQQKQGRVRATTQLKYASINDDGALEMEADAMGARARRRSDPAAPEADPTGEERRGRAAPLAQCRSAAAAGGGVVQAKLIRGAETIKVAWYQWGSAAAHRHVNADETYVLRDDSKVTSNVIHVLRADRKYLLGEKHGDGTWATRTALWSSVDTMHEAGRAVPEAMAPRQGKEQNLESLHAFTVQAALIAQTQLLRAERFHAFWLASRVDTVKARRATAERLLSFLKVGHHYLDQVRVAGTYYQAFLEKYANVEDRRLAPVLTLCDLFKAFSVEIAKLDIELRVLIKELEEDGADAIYPEMDPLSEDLKGRAILERIVTDVLAVIKPVINVDRLRVLASVAGPEDKKDEMDDSLTAAFPLRESAMIANIKAARAPLLVQLGDSHVDRVDAAIAEAVPVKKDTNFETVTRQEG